MRAFQQEANSLLGAEHSPSLSNQLLSLLNRGEALDVTVPEIDQLKMASDTYCINWHFGNPFELCTFKLVLYYGSLIYVLQALRQMHWISEAEAKLREDGLTMDKLRGLLRQGSNITQDGSSQQGQHCTHTVP